MTAANFDRCLKPLLLHEGGNDDDPQDPGGRTSRGITQREYDAWRSKQGLAKRDVWTADNSEVRSIYYTDYWEALNCDALPAGIDYAVFDYGVNSGIYRSAWELQAIVGAKQDAAIGPQTVAAVRAYGTARAINTLCDERLAFLQSLKTWPRFGKGWMTRVADVRTAGLQMATEATSPVVPFPWPQPDVEPTTRPPPPAPPPPVSPIGVAIGAVIIAALAALGTWWSGISDWLRHLLGG